MQGLNAFMCRSVLTPTVTAGAYSANDVIGGRLKFDLSAGGTVGGVTLRRFEIYDNSNQKAALRVYVFLQEPIGYVDNEAFPGSKLNAAELRKLAAYFDVAATDYLTLNNLAFGQVNNIDVDLKTDWQFVWVYVTCTGTPTYGSTSALTVALTGWVL